MSEKSKILLSTTGVSAIKASLKEEKAGRRLGVITITTLNHCHMGKKVTGRRWLLTDEMQDKHLSGLWQQENSKPCAATHQGTKDAKQGTKYPRESMYI